MRKVTQRGPATDAQPRRIGRLPGHIEFAFGRPRAARRSFNPFLPPHPGCHYAPRTSFVQFAAAPLSAAVPGRYLPFVTCTIIAANCVVFFYQQTLTAGELKDLI